MSAECVRREASSSSELNHAITTKEWTTNERNRAGCKLGIFELGAELECVIANSFEVFVADDALEGGAIVKRPKFDRFERIGEGDIHEGGTSLECHFVNNFEVVVEDDKLEGGAVSESHLFDDFEHNGESDTL